MESWISLEHCPFPVAASDCGGTISTANEAWNLVAHPNTLAADALGLVGADRDDFNDAIADVITNQTPLWVDVDAAVFAERRWSRCHIWPSESGEQAIAAIIPLREPRDIDLSRIEIEHIERILEHTADVTAIIDSDMIFRFASGVQTRWLGTSGTAYEGKDSLSFVFVDDHQLVVEAMARCVANPRQSLKIRFRVVHESGDLIWVECIGTNMFDDPLIQGILITLNDITELVEARAAAETSRIALQTEKEHYLTLAQFTPTGVVEFDEHYELGFRNERFDELMGISDAEEFSWELFEPGDADKLRICLDATAPGSPTEMTVRLVVQPPARPRWLTIRAARQGSGTILASVDDATAHVTRQAELIHRVDHDELTGLPNRERLIEMLEEFAASGEPFAVLFLDLDGFKDINDGLGHQVGDEVLVEISQRITTVVRPNDVVGRLHGDEFLIVCRRTSEVQTASEIAARVVDAISRPLPSSAQRLFLSASVGIAMSNDPSTPNASAEELLAAADVAMYEAKRRGGARSVPFSEDLGERAADRLRLHGEVQRAGSLNELEVHYQPIVHLVSGSVAYAEALVRWQHPTQGFMLPERFIPEIEKSELIDELGMWVIDRVVRDLADLGEHAIPANVNVSPRQLADGTFAATTLAVLDNYGVDGSNLTVEITELLMMEAFDAVERQLRTLQERGVSIAVDDFGTGYSALGYLQRFPFDQIKIDGLFIRNIDTDDVTRSITSSIIDLADSLNADVVAEEVERQAQVDVLIDLGCTYAQGFLLGRPAQRT